MVTRRLATLAALDLNLLVFLRELLRERNVTRAAERVGVTQPTASGALARLRRHFGDQLLVRVHGGYVLSPLAVRLAAQIEPVCASLERLFSTSDEFRPMESDREFTLLMPDYVLAAIGDRISRAMYEEAPRIRLHIRVVREALPSDLPEALRLIDGIISAPKAELRAPGIHALELFHDRWVCVVDRDNPVGDQPSLADLENLPWVVPHHPDGGYPPSSPLGPLMARLKNRPRVAVRVDSYQATPYLVAGTDRVAVMQYRLARNLRHTRPDLRVLECPGAPPPITETLWWHEQKDHDEAHQWLRTVIEHAARD